MTDYVTIRRLVAAAIFVAALITYLLTLPPSVVFWDAGEFVTAAFWQQVTHPPGAPLWVMLGGAFGALPLGDPAWRISLFAAICSAAAASVVFLSIARLVARWHPPALPGAGPVTRLATFGGGIVGALAFVWSDSLWHAATTPGIESAAALLVALVLWLLLRWWDAAARAGQVRYLLLIAYVLGLSVGVTPSVVFLVPAIVLAVYLREHEPRPVSIALLLVGASLLAWLGAHVLVLDALPHLMSSLPPLAVGFVVALLAVAAWSMYTARAAAFAAVCAFGLYLLGCTTYTQVLVRAATGPPLNVEDPSTPAALADYIGERQYGDVPLWPRRYRSDAAHRRYQDRYGAWYPPIGRTPDGGYRFDRINGAGELDFLARYQIGHMYVRYLLWNFAGRVSNVQDAGWVLLRPSEEERREFIAPTSPGDSFPITFYALPLVLGIVGLVIHFRRDPRLALVLSVMFLALGPVLALSRNQQQPQPRERDTLYVGSFLVFAVWIGLGASALAEIGGHGIAQADDDDDPTIDEPVGGSTTGAAVAIVACCVLVPLNMAIGGWRLHDRSGDTMAWDYAYTMLQSTDSDAVLFTAGDNDTFPLQYLQDVVGVRRDVRVVNLSLANAGWYVRRLKQPGRWGSPSVPVDWSVGGLDTLGDDRQRARLVDPPEIRLAVGDSIARTFSGDSSAVASVMRWRLHGRDAGSDARELIRTQDRVVAGVVASAAREGWRRPVYFAASVASADRAGLDGYLRREGLALRVVPNAADDGGRFQPADRSAMRGMLYSPPLREGTYFTQPHRGLRLTRTGSRPVLGEEHRRVLTEYRMMFIGYAEFELRRNHDSTAAIAALRSMESYLPSDRYPKPYWVSYSLARLFTDAGAVQQGRRQARSTVDAIDRLAGGWRYDRFARAYHPVQIRSEMLVLLGDFDGAIETYQRLQGRYPDDPNLRAQLEELRVRRLLEARRDTSGAIEELERIVRGYGHTQDPTLRASQRAFELRLRELRD